MNIDRLAVGELQTNCYILSDRPSGSAAIIDPGGEADRIAEKCRQDDLCVELIINTHIHADHVAADDDLKKRFPDSSLCVGEHDAKLMDDPGGNLALMLGMDQPLPEADRLLAEGDTIQVGGVELSVLHTPGHTPGSISLVLDADDPTRVFCGDLIFRGTVGRTDLPGGSRSTLRESIMEKIAPMPDDTILLPGHEAMTTVGEERQNWQYI